MSHGSQTAPHAELNDEPRPMSLLRRWTLDFHNRTILFRVGNWIFTTYAFIAAVAFATGFAGSLWYDAMAGLDVLLIAKLYLFLVVPGVLVGLRLFSIMLEWRELFRRPLATIVKPGYMLHGGIFGGVLSLYAVSVITGAPFLKLLDAPALALPLGEAIARLGCYVYGCCWGRPTESRFGVRYTSPHSKVVRCAPHLHNVKIHPAQLYALCIYLAMFAAMYAALPYMPFDGALTAIYFLGHSAIRYSLEFFRQDDRGKLWGKLTHTNLYSLVMVFAGIGILAWGFGSGTHTQVDLSVRLIHVVTNGAIAPWIAMYGLVFGFAYGVHYKKVGSWIQSPSGGMNPNVDELSMGAVQRMEKASRGEPACDHDHAH
ncbi:MAG: prolipoprotein diacylglyceryl transferase family protein [Nannocystaceae bacterium]